MSRVSENVGASTSRNTKGLHGLYRDSLTLPDDEHTRSKYAVEVKSPKCDNEAH
jgi:hypothetical protein